MIQDTLLLERFLVRRANELGLPTLVVQWAFSFPQAMYDRIRTFQYGSRNSERAATAASAAVTAGLYRGVLGALGLKFDLVNSYGGGEARQFAVMGEAFRDQFVAQGVRGKEIVVMGHPTHDTVFQQAQSLDACRARRHPGALQLAGRSHDRAVRDPAGTLAQGHHPRDPRTERRAIAAAVHRRTGCELVLKLHPREDPADYAFCATRSIRRSAVITERRAARVDRRDSICSSRRRHRRCCWR